MLGDPGLERCPAINITPGIPFCRGQSVTVIDTANQGGLTSAGPAASNCPAPPASLVQTKYLLCLDCVWCLYLSRAWAVPSHGVTNPGVSRLSHNTLSHPTEIRFIGRRLTFDLNCADWVAGPPAVAMEGRGRGRVRGGAVVGPGLQAVQAGHAVSRQVDQAGG